MYLSDFIENRIDEILEDWETFAATRMPAANGLDSLSLRDVAREMLKQTAKDMRTAQSRSEQTQKSRGERSHNSPQLTASARSHAMERIGSAFSLEQVIGEFRALRASVIRRWSDQLTSAVGQHEIGELTRFNEAVDQLMTESVTLYDRRSRDIREQGWKQYRALADLSPDAILVNSEGRFVYVNAAAAHLLGAESRDEVIGKAPFDFLPSESQQAVRERIKSVLHGSPIPKIELVWKRVDGTPIGVEVAGGLITWNDRPSVQIIARDVTERNQREKALREADRRKDDFMATLAHELRNPLAPIQTGVNILEMAGADSEQSRHALQIVSRQVKHLKRLIDDLLDLSRITRGKISLHTEPTNVPQVVRNAIESLSEPFKAGNRTVDFEIKNEPLTVRGDGARLLQVVSNLLNNSIKFTDEGAHIWISLSREGRYARLSVRDDGIGVAPQAIGHLFEPFMQVDSLRAGGLGIGLSLVKKLIELHGGSVEARSEGLSHGTEIIVRLPLVEEAEAARPGKPGTVERLKNQRPLVVDDNQDAADSLAMLLDMMGSQTRIAHDGPSALGYLESFRPNTVFLDIAMPGMDGYAVARKIRERKYDWPLRLIALTGFGQALDRHMALMAGFDYFLVKPVNIGDIEALLRSAPDLALRGMPKE